MAKKVTAYSKVYKAVNHAHKLFLPQIVSHIAISVNDMVELRRRLKQLNVPSRKNVSVPNPADKDTGIVDQVPIL